MICVIAQSRIWSLPETIISPSWPSPVIKRPQSLFFEKTRNNDGTSWLLYGNEELGSFMRRSEWSEKRESNPRPRAWEARALPTELFSLKEIWQEIQYKSGYWKKAIFRASLGFIFWFRNLRVFRWLRIFSGPPALEEDEDGKKEADAEADADCGIRQLRSL